jgi:hypothetical protein
MVRVGIAGSAIALSHKPLFRNELPTSGIDPLLGGVVLAKKHVGYVFLGEA